MSYKEVQKNKKERRVKKERKLIIKGIFFGVLLSIITVKINNYKTPKIEDYMVYYAGEGQTITSICQEEYSSETIDKIGMNTLRYNCIEEDKDGILKMGERVLIPVYEK